MGDIITQVEKYERGWRGGLPETPCGHGSKLSSTVEQRKWIPEMIRKYAIRSVADVGAGDLNWARLIDWSGVDYVALDLVPRHPAVIRFDLIHQVPPQVDLLLVLWVLNHFPFDHCRRAIENLKASGSTYLMMTDRLRYRPDQPPEIDMPAIESLPLNDKGDSIKLVAL